MKNPALFNAILTNPLDDAPRLAYARWLKANGEKDLADFIKVQCDRAARDRFDPAQEKLEKKEKSLLKKHEKEWLAELPEWARQGSIFRRGFVGVVAVDLETFARRAAELVKLTPVDGIQLSSGGVTAKGMKALTKCPEAAQLTELSLWYNEVGEAGAKVIASSPLFANLKALKLGVVGITNAGAKALAESPHLAGLTELNLGGNEMTLTGIRAITESAWKLTTLALDNMDLRGKSMAALGSWEGLGSVRDLSLENAQLGSAEAKALASSPHLTNLRALHLGCNPITAAGVAALADSPALTNLIKLQLSTCQLEDDAAPALLRFSRLAGLKQFGLFNNKFSEGVRQELLARFGSVVSPF